MENGRKYNTSYTYKVRYAGPRGKIIGHINELERLYIIHHDKQMYFHARVVEKLIKGWKTALRKHEID